MAETYYAGAYWLARHESAEQCAQHAESFFRLLGRCEPTWNRWHEPADSFDEARHLQASTDAAGFTKRFQRKENQQLRDGFNFWLWAGDNAEETTSSSGACGSSSQRVPSSCVLRPPTRGLIAERILTAPIMTEVVRAMAMAWEPEWAVATSHAHQALLTGDADPDTFVGWVMYFSHRRGTVPSLPAPVRLEPLADLGTLVVLTPERLTASNPEHLSLAARVHTLLDAAGLLGPLRP